MLCSVIEHGMTPVRFQTAQKNSASLRSSLWQFENSVTSYCALKMNHAHLLMFNCLLFYNKGIHLKFSLPYISLLLFLDYTFSQHFTMSLGEI